MSTAAAPWTDPAFAPDSAGQELRPYRVTIGDELYDQRLFTNDTAHRYQNYTSGIGSGKTVAGIMRVAAHVERWNPGELGMIVTPTSLGLKNVILPELSKWGFLDRWEYNGPQSEEPGLHAPNGTRILLESADNDRKIERLRGPSLAWFWMDEAALIPEKAWRILVGRLRTGQYRNAFVTTTPKGFNWVYDKFVDEATALNSVRNVIGVPSYANPHLPLDYRREILGEYEGQFHAQEVLGKFVTFEGLVYPWFDAEAHVIDGFRDTIQQIFYGVDWGFYPHPAAIVAWAYTGKDRFIALGEHYETRNTVEDLATVMHEMYDAYGRGPVYCDPSEPSNIETFQRKGIAAQKADNSVTPGIQHVSSLADRLFVMDSCQALINELNQYRYADGGDEPLDENDHAADASRYALFTHNQKGTLNAGVVFG